jgi:hypothetical protein
LEELQSEQNMMKRVETLSFFMATVAALSLATILGTSKLAPRQPASALPVVQMETIVITAQAPRTPEQLASVE